VYLTVFLLNMLSGCVISIVFLLRILSGYVLWLFFPFAIDSGLCTSISTVFLLQTVSDCQDHFFFYYTLFLSVDFNCFPGKHCFWLCILIVFLLASTVFRLQNASTVCVFQSFSIPHCFWLCSATVSGTFHSSSASLYVLKHCSFTTSHNKWFTKRNRRTYV
jgi:hypothetical protein